MRRDPREREVKTAGCPVDGPGMNSSGVRRRLGSAVIAALAALAVASGLPQADAAAVVGGRITSATSHVARQALPERLSHLGNSKQVVVVRAANWATSYATLVAWQQGGDGTWHRFMAPVPARLGWNGFAWAARRVQNSGETPAGTFRLLRGFGIVRPPGVSLRYQVVSMSDWWPYDPRDPRTYNVQQTSRPRHAHWRTSWAEHLATYRTQYRYAVVLNYNLPSGVHFNGREWVASHPANTHKGGGIFLHVNGDGATAGCVSVSRPNMRTLLRWLDPSDHPRIVMGPRAQLTNL
jgi:L,D-peptidoglycan transpeptidase YkuD (ErfK/YbiS/YcfS/YnhG family)